MNNSQHLEHLNKSDILYDDRVDICNLQIDKDAPVEMRAAQYIEQIKNPYAYRCGDLAVNVVFSPNGKTLENSLITYFTMLKKS